jgi:hypothetical protein
MKRIQYLLTTIILAFGFCSCKQSGDNSQILQNRIDSLELKIANIYTPGFGEFMSSVQAHHSKLWFAGQNQNWKLADFEVHELIESVENIKKFEVGRKESQLIEMIDPSIDSVNIAIKLQDPVLFKASFLQLTNTCNKCHQVTDFGFNRVIIPQNSPFSNQEFKVLKP